jgi:hypothetical protein
MKPSSISACALLFAVLPAGAIAQSVVDFETVPGGAPADQLAISTQYLAEFGVTFSLEGGGTPYLERTGAGDPGHGFYNADFAAFDVESTTYAGQLGDYFLRFGTSTFFTAPGPVLVIEYSAPDKRRLGGDLGHRCGPEWDTRIRAMDDQRTRR